MGESGKRVGYQFLVKMPTRLMDIFDIKGPYYYNTYIHHPRVLLTDEEKRKKNRDRVREWRHKHGLHLGKIGRPKNDK